MWIQLASEEISIAAVLVLQCLLSNGRNDHISQEKQRTLLKAFLCENDTFCLSELFVVKQFNNVEQCSSHKVQRQELHGTILIGRFATYSYSERPIASVHYL